MFRKKIAMLVLALVMVIGGTCVTAFGADSDLSEEHNYLQLMKFAVDDESTQEEKLEVLTLIVAEHNSELHAELVAITNEHDIFHQEATASQEANQANRKLEVFTIMAALEAGDISKAQAKKALTDFKTEMAELSEALGEIKSNKTKEDGQLKAASRALGAELIAEFSKESPETAVINELLVALVDNQRVHLEIDYRYQAQIDELLGLS